MNLHLIVGSTNPVKVQATRDAVDRLHDGYIDVESVDVESGVSDMPTSIEEARQGAKNRADAAYRTGSVGVGIEGYVEEIDGTYYLSVWAGARHDKGYEEAGSGRYPLPGQVKEQIQSGKELADVMADLHDEHGINKREGAIGYYTMDHVPRKDFVERAVLFCLTQIR